eukprot:Opistho-1_new@71625
MALALGHHAGQQAHGHAQAAEVVELHGALEVVETVVAAFDRAADRAARVVDQEVHATVVGDQQLHGAVGIRHVGDVGRVGNERVALVLRLLAGFIELVLVAPADDRHGAGLGELVRRRQANARAAAGDQHHLARHRALEAAVDVQVGIEVALPVVPQPPRVVLQVGACDAAALERGQRLAAVEARRVVDEGHHVLGQPEVLHDGLVDAAHRCQRHQALLHALGNEAHQRGVDEQVHLGRVSRLAEDVEHVADAVAHGVHQVETRAAAALLVADVVERVDHEVDRHDVDAPALQAPCTLR